MGREGKADFNEPSAPDKPDKMTMGASCQWYTVEAGHETVFPELPWAHQFSKESIRILLILKISEILNSSLLGTHAFTGSVSLDKRDLVSDGTVFLFMFSDLKLHGITSALIIQ